MLLLMIMCWKVWRSLFKKTKSTAENINLSLFEEFFESSPPADYAKNLNNVNDLNENKETGY